jgi:sugar/nucleoside kinase (ribokinase family)
LFESCQAAGRLGDRDAGAARKVKGSGGTHVPATLDAACRFDYHPARRSMDQSGGASTQIVVAGHICLDIIPVLSETPDLRPGGLVGLGPAVISTGGPVGNVGLALHRLGVPVSLMAKVGDDEFGRVLLDVLRRQDPRLADGMIVGAGETTSYSVVINPPGVDRSFLHCPGANSTFGAADVLLDRLAGARIFHFGYPPIMRRLYSDGGIELHALLRSVRGRGLVTSLDVCEPDPHSEAGRVDWVALLARALPAVDIFAPSVDELCTLLRCNGTDPINLDQLRALSDRVLAMGPAVVALKLGHQGLYVRTIGAGDALDRLCGRLGLDIVAWRDCEVLAPCFRAARIAGTTGSGDCTIAGVLAALLRGDDPVAAATAATAVGACSVEAPDATSGVTCWPDVAARLASGWPRLPVSPQFAAATSAWQRDAHGTLFAPVSREGAMISQEIP